MQKIQDCFFPLLWQFVFRVTWPDWTISNGSTLIDTISSLGILRLLTIRQHYVSISFKSDFCSGCFPHSTYGQDLIWFCPGHGQRPWSLLWMSLIGLWLYDHTVIWYCNIDQVTDDIPVKPVCTTFLSH